MSEHREWEYNSVGASVDKAKEHNATVRAYRDAMAECERLGRANDDACDMIADLDGQVSTWRDGHDLANARVGVVERQLAELEARPVLTWEECDAKLHDLNPSVSTFGEFERDIMIFLDWLKSRLPAPIPVPFSDEQIEAMAKAAQPIVYEGTKWHIIHESAKTALRRGIRAAIAAGGLEPESAELATLREKVANQRKQLRNLERREESRKFAALTAVVPERANDEELARFVLQRFSDGPVSWEHEGEGAQEHYTEVAAAVRARVEAPLLAEIERLTRDRDGETLAGEESAEIIGELKAERDALNAEIERLEIQCQDRAFYVTEFAAVSQERDALKSDLAAIFEIAAQDDADTALEAVKKLSEYTDTIEWREAHMDSAHKSLTAERDTLKARAAELEKMVEQASADFELAVRSRDWQHEAHLVCKRLADGLCAELEAEREKLGNALHDAQGNKDDYQRTRAELEAVKAERDTWRDNHDLLNARENFAKSHEHVKRLQYALLSVDTGQIEDADIRAELDVVRNAREQLGLPVPSLRQPVDPVRPKHLAEEFCKRFKDGLANCGAFSGMGNWDSVSFKAKQAWIPVMDECLEYFGLKAASYAAAHGCPLDLRTDDPIAPADTLEKLAEIGYNAYKNDEPTYMQWDELGAGSKLRRTNEVAAILCAAKARVDIETAVAYDWIRGLHTPDSIRDYINSRITFGVEVPPAPVWTGPTRAQAEAKWKEIYHVNGERAGHRARKFRDWLLPLLPTERAEMPSAESLADILKTVPALRHQSKLMRMDHAEKILTALRPWLRTPTGWELDVTAEEVAPLYWRARGTNDNIREFEQLCKGDKDQILNGLAFAIDLCRSRIRPTFGPCQECARRRPIPSEYDLANILWKVDSPHTNQAWSELATGRQTLYVELARAARAALEGK